jgi:hypothetical protein
MHFGDFCLSQLRRVINFNIQWRPAERPENYSNNAKAKLINDRIFRAHDYRKTHLEERFADFMGRNGFIPICLFVI